MVQEITSRLAAGSIESYWERGFYFPIRAFNSSETAEFRGHFDRYYAYYEDRLAALPPRMRSSIVGHTHTFLNWVYRIASHPRVLDAVESILGPNLLVFDSVWFVKKPGDKQFISWHQDATYWGLHPPAVTTAWIALSNSTPQNGCVRVVAGSHKNPILPHNETYGEQNALSRGQEIAVEVDERNAVDLVLAPGEFSLHDVAIVHGSNANTSAEPRIGIAIRYITPEVKQDGNIRQFALLVRGEDRYHHYDLIDVPRLDDLANNALQAESLERIRKNALSMSSSAKTNP